MPVLRAIYDEEIKTFLQKLNLLQEIQNGERFCARCNKKITLENFGAVRKKNGEFFVYCNSPECVAMGIGNE